MSKQFGKFFKIKGYYLALALCAVAMGVAGYLYYSRDTVPVTVIEDTQPPAMEHQDDYVPVLGTTPPTETPTEATQPTAPAETGPTFSAPPRST